MPDAGEPNQAVNLPPPRQRPWDEDVVEPLPADAGFTDVEHWAWSKIIRGEIADMRFATGEDDEVGIDANRKLDGENGKALKPWPESRVLSATFFETILFHEPWASARAKPVLRVECAWIRDQLDWQSARIAGEISLYNCRLDSRPNFKDLYVERLINIYGCRLALGLSADRICIDGALFCRGGTAILGNVELMGSRISGDAQFVETHFDTRLDLTGAAIAGELQFDQGGDYPPTWGENARLVLRNVTCGALAGAIESFRRSNAKGKRTLSVPVDLLGLSFSRIGGTQGYSDNKGATLADAPHKELIAFLRSDAPKNHVFTPQPYRQLADALMAAGREQTAHQIRFALLEHERAAKGVPLTRKAALFLSRHLIGHGFENWRAALGFTLVVLATAAIGLWYQGHPFVTDPAAMDFRAMGDWGGYALGNAIPLLELDPAHKTFVADRFGETAPLGLKTWLYSFKLLGFLLLSYLAAGLSGFASRSARS